MDKSLRINVLLLLIFLILPVMSTGQYFPPVGQMPADSNYNLDQKTLPTDLHNQVDPYTAGQPLFDSALFNRSKAPKIYDKVQPPAASVFSDTIVVDTFYFDSFYFLGKHDSGTTLCLFSFEQSVKPGKENTAKFVGALSWKKKWFNLEPLEKFPLEMPGKQIIPAHPAYDFNWPTSAKKGEFYYHFGQVYLSIVFNELLPLYSVNTEKDNQSDFFICNAVLQGKENEVEGILLYHRIRVHKKRDLIPEDDISQIMLQSPKKFLYLNTNYFETYVVWVGYPFPGEGPEHFALKINPSGTISTSIREVDFISSIDYTPGMTPIFWGGEFIVPEIDLKFTIRTFSYSEKIDNKILYNVDGFINRDSVIQKLNGFLIDYRPEIEHGQTRIQNFQTQPPVQYDSGAEVNMERKKWFKSRTKKKSNSVDENNKKKSRVKRKIQL